MMVFAAIVYRFAFRIVDKNRTKKIIKEKGLVENGTKRECAERDRENDMQPGF